MQRGIFRSFGLLIGTMLCFSTSASSPAAQETAPLQPGVITSFAPIVEKVALSVVTVFTTQTVSRTQVPFPFSDDALRQLFGGQLPQRQGKQTLQGLGSGVIVSPDGYSLTANHVVSGAEEIMIGLGTELRKYKAKKIGTDSGTDVALLKIDEKECEGPCRR
jgi:S1-C subfamily serine protease